jgi:hypothetical protein
MLLMVFVGPNSPGGREDGSQVHQQEKSVYAFNIYQIAHIFQMLRHSGYSIERLVQELFIDGPYQVEIEWPLQARLVILT